MPDWLNIRVDGISFFLGVAAGTLFWFLFGQFRKSLFPYLLTFSKRKLQEFRDRNFIGANIAIRQDALKRAQKSHLAAQLFALDEILISPRLIPPPPLIDPTQENDAENLAVPSFPYLPDWPEVASTYQNDLYTLTQLVEKDANLVIVGQPGSGKSVCLAQFACDLARKDSTQNNTQAKVPIFLHIEDLLINPLPLPEELVPGISKALSARLPIFVQSRVPTFLKLSFSASKAIFLLDGLDELPRSRLKDAVDYLRLLTEEFPHLQIVTTGSSGSLDGLLTLGFYPVTIANWNDNDRTQFIQNWGQSWQKLIIPEIARKSNIETIDPIFINNWIDPHQTHLTPLEWTLNIWAVYSGEGGKPGSFDAPETYITRNLPETSLREPLQKLALELVKNSKNFFSQSDIDTSFSQLSSSQPQLFDPSIAQGEVIQKPNEPAPDKEQISISSRWINALAQNGLISEQFGHNYRFSHICIMGYLASTQDATPEIQSWLSTSELWEPRQLATGYFFARYPDQFSISNETLQGKPPFFNQPLMASRWLRSIPPGGAMRARLMKRLADGVMDETLFTTTRLRFASALVKSNDPSMGVLFRQLLSSGKAKTRAIACLALGMLNDKKSLDQLASLLVDADSEVRNNACYAFGSFQDQTSLDLLTECLSAEDETLRLASAETLARDPINGYKILETEANSENLLVRRSVVFGLSHIKENWALELLKQLAIQDGQWVVRNAASQALDILQSPDPVTPHPLPSPSETPWLFAYAAKLGMGIPQGDPATDILLHALQSGSLEEQLASLDHLRLMQDEKITAAVTETAINAPHPLNEAAQYALWYMENTKTEGDKLNRVRMN
jgi:HEAT repeat protein